MSQDGLHKEDKLDVKHVEGSTAETPGTVSPFLQSMPGAPSVEVVAAGAKLEEEERTMTVLEAVKRHWVIVLYCLVPCLGTLGFGFDQAANNAIVLPSFLAVFGEFDATTQSYAIPSLWLSLWTAMGQAGQFFGALGAGLLQDRLGHRIVFVGFAVLSVVGIAVQYISTTRGVLLAGKILNGGSIGAFYTLATSYISEIAPVRLRGPLVSCANVFALIGIVIGIGANQSVVNVLEPRGYKFVFALQWLEPGLIFLVMPFLPDSPMWRIKRGHPDKAIKAMARLCKKGVYDGVDIILARLSAIQVAVSHELEKTAQIGEVSYLQCFHGVNRKRTVTVIMIFVTQQMAGVAFLGNSIYFLLMAGLSASLVFQLAIATLAASAFFSIVSWFLLEGIGRRPVFVIGSAIQVCMLAIIGGLWWAQSSAGVWALAIFVNLAIITQNMGTGSPGWAASAEISSVRLRSKTQSIGLMTNAAVNWVMLFVTPYIFNSTPGSANLGAKTAFVFMAATVLCTVWAYFYFPETKGLTFTQIDDLYERNVSPRHFEEAVPVVQAAETATPATV